MKPNITVDAVNYTLLRGAVGIGKIVELPPEDAGLLAQHIPIHPDTIYAACSGVPVREEQGLFRKGDIVVAIEWVRHETKPVPGEPECNLYRYVFVLSTDGTKCIGFEVTRRKGNDGSDQVGDHWTEFDEVFNRHFKNP